MKTNQTPQKPSSPLMYGVNMVNSIFKSYKYASGISIWLEFANPMYSFKVNQCGFASLKALITTVFLMRPLYGTS